MDVTNKYFFSDDSSDGYSFSDLSECAEEYDDTVTNYVQSSASENNNDDNNNDNVDNINEQHNVTVDNVDNINVTKLDKITIRSMFEMDAIECYILKYYHMLAYFYDFDDYKYKYNVLYKLFHDTESKQ